ncbi:MULTISPECIES: flagellar biosynthesis protein FlhA [unclassified Gilliamella]|uniref:flagellar biosynthesis protein FlhA n=1 Tax=unclassified Gilliamella TaxID=2685620 RepID=UPI00226AF038|nr:MULTISPECIES: flagellar biosynthesis protein FlhA [unclassified Gilliamella]MCX8575058.1 flagellar biosynthesis protein FlhA [Gilliamella sp. B3831]MCX8577440.1 flagellar biosynthesis protein FlhA [Gilliamella sp. B3815]MCX8590317.1 flagellar biosynthesis protein FlhA [Gilliamella sp. B3812]MCX8604390.1 flagellar biosynthesis protein FlhA [Gilliamella sp. B3823]MCX8605403.1 flagellar biosynthesis protein FlhA [Gilliamella sp. B3825]
MIKNKIVSFLSTNGLKKGHYQILAGPLLILLILSMMVLPLPAFILDLFFTFNIALSIIILIVALFTKRVLDFAAFPTVLLFATLLRLSLNVASTRVVLLKGHTGSHAAGRVIEAFGHFLVGGNFAIGIVVFIILVIINFMVITKGAGRIAEVGARFALDGMPGKQMAIDADLNAGLIGEDEAKARRAEVTQEADFYGSMDGASKFVRGDAIAGLLIMAITIIGGLLVGVVQHGMALADASQTYVLLTIGDGLVAQIPSLIISTAAGVIVTRVTSQENISEQMLNQLFKNPQVLILTAVVIGLLGLIPGMPNLVFLLFTAILVVLSWWLNKQKKNDTTASTKQVDTQATTPSNIEASWSDVSIEDILAMEVGYGLIPMVDQTQNGELLGRIRSLRKKFAQTFGFLPPQVHIRDNLSLAPYQYKLFIKGGEIGKGEIVNNKWLAINPGNVSETIDGIPTTEPAFGLPAVWIDASNKENAQILGYTVVDTSTMIATHFNHLLQQFASDLLGRVETQELLDHVKQDIPKLVEDFIPGVITLTTFHKILQNLIAEKVSIRDMRTIIETISEHAPNQNDAYQLLSLVRIALGRVITQQWFPGNGAINVIGLNVNLERLLLQALQNTSNVEPGLADHIIQQVKQALNQQDAIGAPPVLLVNHTLRPTLSQFLRPHFPQLVVLSNLEITDNREIKMTCQIGTE